MKVKNYAYDDIYTLFLKL